MNKRLLFRKALFMCLFVFSILGANAQTFKDDIMLQAFSWDVHNQASVIAEGGLYNFLNNRAGSYAAAGITVLWMPPPSKSSGGVGYIPTELYNFSQTVYGKESQLTTLLTNLNSSSPKIHAMADVVVNHRGGSTNWTDFTNPAWDCKSITSTDEANTGVITGVRPCGTADTGDDFGGARDLDHRDIQVQNGVKEYLTRLKALGFDSWRWDMVKGFSASYVGTYNTDSAPHGSVGEYWDGNVTNVKNWVDGTTKKSTAFDFPLYYNLSSALLGNYSKLAGTPGLSSQTGYKDLAVTFIDNHDTFVKTEWIAEANVMKGYAYILTHPGIPCVFFSHYYGGTYTKDGVTRTYTSHQNDINVLMAVRKANAINALSTVSIQTATTTEYLAIIDGKVAVRLGSTTTLPTGTGWIENASGTGYKVWSKVAVNVAPTVAISPVGGSFVAGTTQSVTIAATDDKVGSIIYYTTDGTTPTATSSVYSTPINVSVNTTIKAIAKDVDGLFSGVTSQTYTFTAVGNITVRFLPPSSWAKPINVHHWSATPLANLADSSWPGKAMTGPDTGGYYSYTFSNIASTNLLFDSGKGSPQTADINGVNKNTCYNMSTGTLVEETCGNLGLDTPLIGENKISLYPNPVIDSFKINGMVSNLYIYDLNGRIVKQQSKSLESNTAIDISELGKGIYFITAKDENGSNFTLKIIKK
ncbi:chitobiase/beta-hexosaminidase C-terminal domain-containing protein [Flavobacterium taihuense]|uniref:Chitobiase/beta-hexosaminidase C-terminal domain-containing protein n=1 Tax=Flavobacterium taihuense TaxID=2857508 RepID=A0ABS6XUT2_9FLAO|nr:chitobiase/beta-hexosaminidase C-terminal domain-containing protein [Flavobacterium taihuense]MBW4360440.1 chitobiase/beta-hexosaminidase C-terminal domain-containing protein [Flavobacterium taihuense]